MELGILNVGAGDTKLSFDPSKPAEVKRASRAVKDMLKRGFAILIEVGKDEHGPLYRRATDFDEKTAEYIIVGAPDDEEEVSVKQASPSPRRRKGKAQTTKRVPAEKARGVAVARVAGG
jgi:hypothetical protein